MIVLVNSAFDIPKFGTFISEIIRSTYAIGFPETFFCNTCQVCDFFVEFYSSVVINFACD